MQCDTIIYRHSYDVIGDDRADGSSPTTICEQEQLLYDRRLFLIIMIVNSSSQLNKLGICGLSFFKN